MAPFSRTGQRRLTFANSATARWEIPPEQTDQFFFVFFHLYFSTLICLTLFPISLSRIMEFVVWWKMIAYFIVTLLIVPSLLPAGSSEHERFHELFSVSKYFPHKKRDFFRHCTTLLPSFLFLFLKKIFLISIFKPRLLSPDALHASGKKFYFDFSFSKKISLRAGNGVVWTPEAWSFFFPVIPHRPHWYLFLIVNKLYPQLCIKGVIYVLRIFPAKIVKKNWKKKKLKKLSKKKKKIGKLKKLKKNWKIEKLFLNESIFEQFYSVCA